MELVQIALAVVGGVVVVLTGVVAILRAIPGDQGEEKLQAIVDFLARLIQGA